MRSLQVNGGLPDVSGGMGDVGMKKKVEVDEDFFWPWF